MGTKQGLGLPLCVRLWGPTQLLGQGEGTPAHNWGTQPGLVALCPGCYTHAWDSAPRRVPAGPTGGAGWRVAGTARDAWGGWERRAPTCPSCLLPAHAWVPTAGLGPPSTPVSPWRRRPWEGILAGDGGGCSRLQALA